MLKSAYPKGISESDELPLMRALYDHMSHRALARVMSSFLGAEYPLVLNRVHEAAAVPEAAAEVQIITSNLKKHGYVEWCKEE